ncbi:MAG: peroxiredoxin [Polyangiales bacterium]
MMERLAWVLALVLLAACGGAQVRPDGGKGLLPEGSQVPDLSQNDQEGRAVKLREDVPTLVYFYPRAGTPGCTKEACAFRDAWQRYESAGLRVIGVSSDDEEDQAKFAKEHQLPFSLIADPEHVWSSAFGVGSFIGMDSRVSFLVDAQGNIKHVYHDVDPGVHAQEVLDDAKQRGLL